MSAYALHVLDRAIRTALQVLAGYFVAAQTIGGVDWHTALLAALLAVVVAILQGLVDLPALPWGGWLPNALGRALRTFAQTALGSTTAAVWLTDIPWATVLDASALAALASLVTSLIATPMGPTATQGTPELVAPHPARHVEAV